MLFFKSLALLALPILAVATPWGAPTTTSPPSKTTTVTVTSTATSTPASSCSTGDLQCCNSVQSASSPGVATLLGLLGIVVQGIGANVGLTCSPITVIGAGGGSCSAQAVCCQDNSHGGLVSIGCLPVTL